MVIVQRQSTCQGLYKQCIKAHCNSKSKTRCTIIVTVMVVVLVVVVVYTTDEVSFFLQSPHEPIVYGRFTTGTYRWSF